ncbi:hypothetical protein N1F89_13110 [Aquibium sp. A9E412]|uniref:hypothetical protein n=1 Tax=Aquibium sp. A9E412 TaxID=2976767 RepID=UPI0025AF7F4B|nr:hypothetical protein [Aquibium sp. A9E412]MDN2567161.1 hypothetical protein [Aquibium sp. A9E412]
MHADAPFAEAGALRRAPRQSRGRLMRRLALFQVKLFADGFRDVVMSPLSFLAGAFGILTRRDDPEVYFERLMHFGRDTDRWINLFDQHDPADPRRAPTLDRVADAIETAVRRDYAAGGLSARSAARLARLAARLRRGDGAGGGA